MTFTAAINSNTRAIQWVKPEQVATSALAAISARGAFPCSGHQCPEQTPCG